MLLEFEKTEVTKSNILQEKSFALANPKIIINLLRNKIYTNPTRTMLQEIISNAIDANIENGKAHVPITVHVPFELEPYFFISDSGIGIDPDRMENVFILYGASTKRGDNNQIGGFGIGAKSPFSYTDQFVIETVTKDGYERHYIAFLDEEGDEKLTMTFEEKTTKDTGTIIKVGIKQDDFYKICDYTNQICRFMKVTPTIIGADFDIPERINLPFKTEDDWEIVSGQENRLFVVINGIPYECRNVTVPFNGETLVLYFNTGEVTIAANREGIEVNEKNQKVIQNKINFIFDKFFCIYRKWIYSFKSLVSLTKHNRFDVKRIMNIFGIHNHFPHIHSCCYCVERPDEGTTRIDKCGILKEESVLTPWMMVDTTDKLNGRILRFFELNPSAKKLCVCDKSWIYRHTNNFNLTKKFENNQSYKNLIDCGIDVVFSHCYSPVKIPSKKRKTEEKTIFIRRPDRNIRVPFEPPADGETVNIFISTRDSVMVNGLMTHMDKIDRIMSIYNKVSEANLKYCFVHTSDFPSLRKYKDKIVILNQMIDDIVEHIIVWFDSVKEQHAMYHSSASTNYGISRLAQFDEDIKKEFSETLVWNFNREDNFICQDIVGFLVILHQGYYDEVSAKMDEKTKAIVENYPLLRFMNKCTEEDIQHFAEYIKLKRNEETKNEA